MVSLNLSLCAQALCTGQWAAAMSGYLRVLPVYPDLSAVIAGSLALVRYRHRRQRQGAQRLQVVVCGWEPGHDAASRAYTLAESYTTFADVEIVGIVLSGYNAVVCEPLRDALVPIHAVVVDDEQQFDCASAGVGGCASV